MRTYYIVEHDTTGNQHMPGRKRHYWQAHSRGLLSIFNVFNLVNFVQYTCTFNGANDCVTLLKHIKGPKEVRIVRTVEL